MTLESPVSGTGNSKSQRSQISKNVTNSMIKRKNSAGSQASSTTSSKTGASSLTSSAIAYTLLMK